MLPRRTPALAARVTATTDPATGTDPAIGRPGTSRKHLRPATVAMLATVLVAGCSAPVAEDPGAAAVPVDVSFGHVHGLGVDTGTGVLFAASHHGVFEVGRFRERGRFAQSEALALGPIAGRSQDTMGFEMHGHRMYGSGHPDPREDLDLETPNLGLIVSEDWARTWTPVSLQGDVDFHDIAVVPGGDGAMRVYGYDAGAETVLVSSDDGETWDAAAQIRLRDLTTDVEDPDTVYATTEQGLAVSTDAGRTFAVLPDAPPLVLVETTADGLIGIATDGAVWVRDAAGSWRATGATEGQVQAITWVADPEPLLVVVDSRGISASRDDGGTWQTLLPAGEPLEGGH